MHENSMENGRRLTYQHPSHVPVEVSLVPEPPEELHGLVGVQLLANDGGRLIGV